MGMINLSDELHGLIKQIAQDEDHAVLEDAIRDRFGLPPKPKLHRGKRSIWPWARYADATGRWMFKCETKEGGHIDFREDATQSKACNNANTWGGRNGYWVSQTIDLETKFLTIYIHRPHEPTPRHELPLRGIWDTELEEIPKSFIEPTNPNEVPL